MSETEIPILSDNKITPTDDYIFSIIGDKKLLWQSIIKYVLENYNNISCNWNYYNDGKQWLFKLTQKKKTIFWAAILHDTFRITFWFGDKAEPGIQSCSLPDTIKDSFRTAKRYGSIRSVSIKVLNSGDVDNVLKLVEIKHNLK